MNSKQIAAIALTLCIIIPLGLGYALNTESHDVTVTETGDQFNISDSMLNASSDYYGALTNPVTLNGPLMISEYSTVFPSPVTASAKIVSPMFIKVGTTVTSAPRYSQISEVLTASGTLTIDRSDDFAFVVDDNSVDLVTNDGETVNVGRSVVLFHYGSGFTVVNGQTYGNIAKVLVHPTHVIGGGVTLEIYYTTPIFGQYSDISAGWQIREIWRDDGVAWTVGHDCRELRIMVDLSYGDMAFTPRAGGDDTLSYVLSSDGGMASVNGRDLGAYRFVEISIGKDSTTVSGISAWPAMGASAVRMNSIALEGTAVDFDTVGLEGSAALRMDSAEIVAGSFPITRDYTLDTSQLFPGLDMSVRIGSVGIFGDGLAFMTETARQWVTFSAIAGQGAATVLPDADVAVLYSWTPVSTGWSIIASAEAEFEIIDGILVEGLTGAEFGPALDSEWTWTLMDNGRYDLKINGQHVQFVSAADARSIRLHSENTEEGLPDVRFSLYNNVTVAESIEITDGRVTFPSGVSAAVTGSMWSWEETEGGFRILVNGQDTGLVSADRTIRFDGTWSLTATAYTLKESTKTVEEWQAGGFALDKTGLCAAGVAVCGFVFVGLGMTGRMQGSKVALLLLVCGGAAAAYLMLL